MDDTNPAVDDAKVKSASKRAKKITFTITFGTLTKVITGLAVLAVLVGIFYLGDHHGAARQKDYDAKTPVNSFTSAATAVTNGLGLHFNAIGTVTSVSDKAIKVKDTRGKEQTAVINKNTIFYGSDLKLTDVKALKTGQRVIVTGTKDAKSSTQTATRIRIEK